MTEPSIADRPAAPTSADASRTPAPEQKRRMPPRPVLAVGVLLLLATAGYFAWRTFFAPPEVPPGVIVVSGRIEGDESSVAAKISGRILEIRAREGDRLNAGDVIAQLDDEQIRARESQAQAQLTQAEARTRAALQQVAVLEEQLGQSGIERSQSQTEAQGRVAQAQAEIAAAEAELASQQASLELAEYDRDAYSKLAKTGAASERQAREAAARAASQAAMVAGARRQVEAAKAALTSATATERNPEIRQAQASVLRRQIAQAQAEVASAQAETTRARALLAEAQANRTDLTIRAPFSGTVATRSSEPGEVVAAGTPILTLVDLNKVYLRGFVPEGQIGRVKVDQPARVYLDSAPEKPLEAYVSRVDPEATFTPENTYFREDRVKQVIGVKLQLKAGAGFAKPGMPADGEILVEGQQWPEGKRVTRQ